MRALKFSTVPSDLIFVRNLAVTGMIGSFSDGCAFLKHFIVTVSSFSSLCRALSHGLCCFSGSFKMELVRSHLGSCLLLCF